MSRKALRLRTAYARPTNRLCTAYESPTKGGLGPRGGAGKRLSVKEMLAAVGLKDRMNFVDYSLAPAMDEGFVCLLYPNSPRHPRQKYLLTVKGAALYNELMKGK